MRPSEVYQRLEQVFEELAKTNEYVNTVDLPHEFKRIDLEDALQDVSQHLSDAMYTMEALGDMLKERAGIQLFSKKSYVLNQEWMPEQRLNQGQFPSYGSGTQFTLIEHLGNDGDLLLRDGDGREFTVDGDVALEIFSSQIPGGVGDNTNPEDVDPGQLAMGIEVEMEHTDDPEIAEEIALDHLTEDPEYYIKLKTIEDH